MQYRVNTELATTQTGVLMVISKLKKAAVALAFLSTFGAANALTVNFGTLTTTVGADDIEVAGSFNDKFTFIAGSLPGVLGSVVGIDFTGDLKAQYRLGVGTTPVWGAYSALAPVPSDNDGVFSYSTTFGSLVAGTKYWINLKGTATDASYSVTLAPVPEPETYALLLAGLGMLGTVARRRRIAAAA